MSEQKLAIVKFAPKGGDSFHDAVKAGVEAYFKEGNISKQYNVTMVVKTIAMLAMYFAPLCTDSYRCGICKPAIVLWLVDDDGRGYCRHRYFSNARF